MINADEAYNKSKHFDEFDLLDNLDEAIRSAARNGLYNTIISIDNLDEYTTGCIENLLIGLGYNVEIGEYSSNSAEFCEPTQSQYFNISWKKEDSK